MQYLVFSILEKWNHTEYTYPYVNICEYHTLCLSIDKCVRVFVSAWACAYVLENQKMKKNDTPTQCILLRCLDVTSSVNSSPPSAAYMR